MKRKDRWRGWQGRVVKPSYLDVLIQLLTFTTENSGRGADQTERKIYFSAVDNAMTKSRKCFLERVDIERIAG